MCKALRQTPTWTAIRPRACWRVSSTNSGSVMVIATPSRRRCRTRTAIFICAFAGRARRTSSRRWTLLAKTPGKICGSIRIRFSSKPGDNRQLQLVAAEIYNRSESEEQHDRHHRTAANHKVSRHRADHHGHEQQRRKRREPRHQQPGGRDDLNRARKVPEPLSEPDRTEKLHHHRVVHEFLRPCVEEHGREGNLQHPGQSCLRTRLFVLRFNLIRLRTSKFRSMSVL